MSQEVPQRHYSRRSQISGPTGTFFRPEPRIKLRKPLWPITCPCPTLASNRAQARSKCAERHFARHDGLSQILGGERAPGGPFLALARHIGDRPSRRATWRSAHFERACARSPTGIQTAGAPKMDPPAPSPHPISATAHRGARIGARHTSSALALDRARVSRQLSSQAAIKSDNVDDLNLNQPGSATRGLPHP